MFLDYSVFCKSHAEHHRYLGDPEKDTDFLHSEEDIAKGWWFVYSKQFFSLDNWLAGGPLGGLRSADWYQRLLVALYWSTLMALIAVSCSTTAALTFAALWIVSRALVHHAIISFVIISDHVGLRPGASILNFARNHSRTSPLRWLIHPHCNGLHLTHHLLPGLPFHSLAAADKLLMTWPKYREASHCSSYFFGRNSAIRSWCGESTVTATSGDER
jgi:fatty acid desaturase